MLLDTGKRLFGLMRSKSIESVVTKFIICGGKMNRHHKIKSWPEGSYLEGQQNGLGLYGLV